MLGAGVFFVWAPAAAAAGSSLLISLLIAAVVAALNAFSSAQLAMAHPVSGGAYAFARATIGPWTGFAAGWLFLAGKTASCAAIALIAGSYLWPDHARVIAVAAIIVFAGLNISGIRTTAVVTTAIVAVVVTGLGIIAAGGLVTEPATSPIEFNGGVAGILQAAGLLFFAFAGYARMATLGEEVIDAAATSRAPFSSPSESPSSSTGRSACCWFPGSERMRLQQPTHRSLRCSARMSRSPLSRSLPRSRASVR